ncbi:MAG: hypothetical protein AAF696_38925, partial [Bacteroidota bacterium]
HGYLLGDEGSGMDLGKYLLKGLLEGKFAEEIERYVCEQEGMDIGQLRTSVYNSKQANRRLASFAPYIYQWKQDEQIQHMLKSRFQAFIQSSLNPLLPLQHIPLDFVGAIGKYFRKELEAALTDRGWQIGHMITNPMEKLVLYHS